MKTSTLLILGGSAVVLVYVMQRGRMTARPGAWQNTPVPAPGAPGSTIYTRPNATVGGVVAATPWGAIATGITRFVQGFTGGGSGAPTPAPSGVSTADIIRSADNQNWPGDLVVYPPEILDGGVAGAQIDPSNPASFFGADPVMYEFAPALDQSSGFDSQAFAMSFV